MDLIGDIVEKEVSAPEPPTFPTQQATSSGFPKPKPKSAWKSRQEKKRQVQTRDGFEVDERTGMKRLPEDKRAMDYSGLSEAEKIHMENIEILSKMSEEQRAREKEELLGTMDPKILQALLRRTEKKMEKLNVKDKTKDSNPEFEGYNTWIGGDKDGEPWKLPTLDNNAVDEALGVKSALKKSEGSEKKGVSFAEDFKEEKAEDPVWEDVEDLDEIAPPSYQIVQEAAEKSVKEAMNTVHFPKPANIDPEDYKLDINDPEFYEKLHEKYFPDLPKDTEKLKWMEPVPDVDTDNLVFDNVADLRFDFKGDLVIPSSNDTIDTSEGLHHHADNPALAGYTLHELARLARSSLAGQRCIAIRTLGRILHKLGKGKYNIMPEFVPEDEDDEPDEPIEADEETVKKATTQLEQNLWALIDELRIIDTLEEAADEMATRNISVRSYATEALWLWKQGGGDKRSAN